MRYLHVILSTLYSILMVTAGIAFAYLYMVVPFDWSITSILVIVGTWLLVFGPLYEYWKKRYYSYIAWYREHTKDSNETTLD
jgi:hypothetical protein